MSIDEEMDWNLETHKASPQKRFGWCYTCQRLALDDHHKDHEETEPPGCSPVTQDRPFLEDPESEPPPALRPTTESEITRLLEGARGFLQLYPNTTGGEPDVEYVRRLVSQAPEGFTSALLDPSLTKRQKWVIGIILRDTHVTTLTLQPANGHLDSRAIRELPERGIPLKESDSVTGTFQARTLDPAAFRGAETGRSGITFKVKLAVIQRAANTCERCNVVFTQPRNFNPDHRRPHALDKSDSYFSMHGIDALQNLCVPCNQKKLTACRECSNTDSEKCYTPGGMICHWADAKNSNHIALEPLVGSGEP
jgi:hypothetical protein